MSSDWLAGPLNLRVHPTLEMLVKVLRDKSRWPKGFEWSQGVVELVRQLWFPDHPAYTFCTNQGLGDVFNTSRYYLPDWIYCNAKTPEFTAQRFEEYLEEIKDPP